MQNLNLEKWDIEISQFLKENKFPAIKTIEDYKKVGDLLKIAKDKRKALEDFRLSITRPFTEQIKFIKSKFDTAGEPLDKIIISFENLMKSFYADYKKQKDEEQARLDKEARENAGPDGVLVPVVNDTKTQSGSIAKTTMRSIAKWRVVNQSVVPRAYLMIDEKKLNEVAKEKGLKAKVKGICFYEDFSLSSR